MLPAPTTGADPTLVLEILADASDASGEVSEKTQLDVRSKAQDKAIQQHLAAVKSEMEEEAKKGSGFFGSIGTIVKDAFNDVRTLHVRDLVTDVKDDGLKALDSKQFWKDLENGALEVAKWGAVASSVALAVATCGSGTAGTVAVVCAVVGASLSTAAAAESEGHFLQKAGLSEKADGWVVIGGSLGGAGVSAVGGLVAANHMAAGATALARTATRVATETSMASAAADVGGGAAHAVVAKYDYDLERAHVDTKAAEMRKQMLKKIVADLNDEVKETTRRRESDHKAALDARETYQTALDKAISWRA
jgi:hypothetical protein